MQQQATRRPRRGRIVAAALLGVAGMGVALLWTQRTPIARSFVDDALTARGVAASYEITNLGFRTQTIENLRIGDPGKPDLTARWARLHIAVGFGGATVRAIEARGVRLRGRVIAGKLS